MHTQDEVVGVTREVDARTLQQLEALLHSTLQVRKARGPCRGGLLLYVTAWLTCLMTCLT